MMQLPKNIGVTKIIIAVAVLIISVIIVFVIISEVGDVGTSLGAGTKPYGNKFLYIEPGTISTHGVTSFQVLVYNDTWLDCDGNNDYIKITPSSNDTLSFWYKSTTTTTWTNIVNVMGNYYVNGVEDTPVEYPVYWDGTDYYFCKTDATTFWEGQIDEIRIYEGQLNSTQVLEVLQDGK
jgi:hypothetical protein